MSRVSKWKLEKNKVKVVFRLQFHATHIPQSGWEKLFISFIPADTGKATAKTTKANVRNGTCKWSDPIYETTRLLQDSRTKLYDEKLYKIVVAMGSSRASILGEASVNLADYVDGLKPSDVSLPLHGCNFGTILHVSEMKKTMNHLFRFLFPPISFWEFEQQRELREKGLHADSAPAKIQYPEEVTIDEVGAHIKFKSDANEVSSLEEEVNPSEEYGGSATGFDGSSNTSGSFSAEKHEVDSKSTTSSPHKVKRGTPDHPNTAQGSVGSDKSTTDNNNELATAFEENSRLRASLELSESSFFNLKLEVDSLQTLADELGSETQKLSRQLAAEASSSEQLANENEITRIKKTTENRDTASFKDDRFVSENGLGLDLCQPEIFDPIDAMKAQIFDLVRELDDAKVEKESLTRKMDQMELYYEALIHELEENQKRMLGELQHVTKEHATCLYNLSVTKSETEKLSQDMSQQMLRFVEEKRDLEAINEELEKRATISEAALKRARLNYSIAVDKLQKDLDVLSSQVTSMFETNESLIKQAVPNQNQEDYETKRKRSFSMHEELYRRAEEELIEMYSMNLNLDIYSRALQEPLIEADFEIRNMKEKIDELVEELKLSTASQNELMVRLQKAKDDIHELNEYKYSSISENRLLEEKLAKLSKENYLLGQKEKDSESTVVACLAENAELSLRLKNEAFENEKLANEASLLKETITTLKAESDELVSSKENLEETIDFVQEKLRDLLASNKDSDFGSVGIKDALLQLEKMQDNSVVKTRQLMEENRNLKSERDVADVAMRAARSDTLTMKESFRSAMQEMVTKLDLSNALVDKFQAQLESVADKIQLGSEYEENYFEQNIVLLSDFARLEDRMQELTCNNNGHLAREISGLDSLAEGLRTKDLTITELMHDKQELAMRLHDKTEESNKLSYEISCLNETLKVLHDELHVVKTCKDELEGKVRDLTFHSDKHQDNLFDFEQQKAELIHELMRKHESSQECVKDLQTRFDSTEAVLNHHLEEKTNLLISLEKLRSYLEASEQQKPELMHVKELASNLELEKSHLLSRLNAFKERNNSDRANFESKLSEMHEYSLLADVKLVYLANHCKTLLEDLQATFLETEANLSTSLESLRSDLEASEAQNKLLSISTISIGGELENCKENLKIMETRFSSDTILRDSEIERLKKGIKAMEEEINGLTASKEELEILAILLKDKVDEQFSNIASLEEQKDELSHKLSEQVLKTEEFKNLSIHLKELKDKAESLTAREKREPEVQDSLRIAFIKEQCQSTVQELNQQLSMSKKHGEEMLLKLQDAIDEIESRKKSEAVSLKKSDELALRMSNLEEELKAAILEKREKSNAYDRTKAELECALLSLECCKEEKEKVADSLREFEEEKSRLAVELSSVKGRLEILKSSVDLEKDELTRDVKTEKLISIQDGEIADTDESAQETAPIGTDPIPELLVTEDSPQSNGSNSIINNEHLGAQKLRFSLEHLHEELEKMKNENTVFNIGHDVGPDREVPQTGITQLQKANEELRNMFPLFDEISSGGNALERVLALEIELAEALKSKNKSNIQFQSSFLKQHSDEEAVLKSFRDINELIKEMLELKGRNADVEAELREMHNRFSQLSLRFAEVEGEREKLDMMLKNVRISKKITLNRSSSANIVDHTS
ncbi:hypothetical protein MIMGU_mgv1a000135mg [Erythranthe guttata]|uniref:C2 NT-type domain-containing protein n=1 Tax=Erythranthe guttata TaxID=4155 RepID=A0A022RV19_ERYGU|nr:hypothetical protein MIMGU_mgv1a000135mg [Erythranthe guttata]